MQTPHPVTVRFALAKAVKPNTLLAMTLTPNCSTHPWDWHGTAIIANANEIITVRFQHTDQTSTVMDSRPICATRSDNREEAIDRALKREPLWWVMSDTRGLLRPCFMMTRRVEMDVQDVIDNSHTTVIVYSEDLSNPWNRKYGLMIDLCKLDTDPTLTNEQCQRVLDLVFKWRVTPADFTHLDQQPGRWGYTHTMTRGGEPRSWHHKLRQVRNHQLFGLDLSKVLDFNAAALGGEE